MDPKHPHVDPAVLVAYRDGDLPHTTHRDVEQHVAACGRCSAELALVDDALSVEAGAEMPTLRRRPRGPWPRRLAPAGLIAASLALLFYGAMQLLDGAPKFGPNSTLRGGGNPLGLEIRVSTGGVIVDWTAVEGADLYEATVLDHRGRAVFALETTDTEVRIPSTELPSPAAGKLAVRIVAKQGTLELARRTATLTETGVE